MINKIYGVFKYYIEARKEVRRKRKEAWKMWGESYRIICLFSISLLLYSFFVGLFNIFLVSFKGV